MYLLWYINPRITINFSIIDVVSDCRLQWIYYNKLLTTMHTGQFYNRTKKSLPPNRIIIPFEGSDDNMVDSSDREMGISIESDIVHVLEMLKNHL